MPFQQLKADRCTPQQPGDDILELPAWSNRRPIIGTMANETAFPEVSVGFLRCVEASLSLRMLGVILRGQSLQGFQETSHLPHQ